MHLSSIEALRPRLRQAVREIKKEFLTPGFLCCFALILTLPLWIIPAVYVLLKSFKLMPSGVLVWMGAIGFAVSALWLIGGFFARVFKGKRGLDAARKRYRAGEPGSDVAFEEARLRFRSNRMAGAARMGYAFAAIHLALPFVAALTLWSDMQSPDGWSGSKVTTPRQRLEQTLAGIEKRGLFKPMGS